MCDNPENLRRRKNLSIIVNVLNLHSLHIFPSLSKRKYSWWLHCICVETIDRLAMSQVSFLLFHYPDFSAGFYRVNYDQRTWQMLAATLVDGDLSVIHPVNRGQILYDSFDLALHGIWSFNNALGFSRFLRRETDYLPWFIGIQWLNVLKAHLYKTECFHLYQVRIRQIYTFRYLDQTFLIKRFHQKKYRK